VRTQRPTDDMAHASVLAPDRIRTALKMARKKRQAIPIIAERPQKEKKETQQQAPLRPLNSSVLNNLGKPSSR